MSDKYGEIMWFLEKTELGRDLVNRVLTARIGFDLVGAPESERICYAPTSTWEYLVRHQLISDDPKFYTMLFGVRLAPMVEANLSDDNE